MVGRLQHKAAVSPSHKAQCMPGWAPQFPSVPLLCRCQLSIAFSKFPVLVMSLLLVAPVVIQKIQGRNKKCQKSKNWGKSCEAEVWLENIGHWHRDGSDLTCRGSAAIGTHL